ncbi:hypothetical protein Leryth_018185 [Lithospermum erythrorhizon]|nr:hypothetical protein Leryth_018185 [Lithospermum erythrorhizon]
MPAKCSVLFFISSLRGMVDNFCCVKHGDKTFAKQKCWTFYETEMLKRGMRHMILICCTKSENASLFELLHEKTNCQLGQ